MYLKELDLDIEQFLTEFIEKERHLLEVDANEQAISNRFGRKLELAAQGWDVDCEYNRDLYKIKTLKYALTENGDIEERHVVPDIIIHKRKTDNNLLAVEVKKVCNKENRFKDQAKLTAFREQLGYRYTLFVDFKTGIDPSIANVVFVAAE